MHRWPLGAEGCLLKLQINCNLLYDFDPGVELIASIQVAEWPGLKILSEQLTLTPDTPVMQDAPDHHGERRFRAAPVEQTRIEYTATVENGRLAPLPSDAAQHAWCDLPAYALDYLLPSRFCPSDRFTRFVSDKFLQHETGGARVHAVLAWIRQHISYVGGVSDAETTAERSFVDRAGVCRDFSHLGISFCRALNIPARIVSAYAWKLDPPDFHAVFEVYLSGSWWMVDPTGLAPIEGLVRIGTGRDAADIAFLTTSGACTSLEQSVAVTEVQ